MASQAALHRRQGRRHIRWYAQLALRWSKATCWRFMPISDTPRHGPMPPMRMWACNHRERADTGCRPMGSLAGACCARSVKRGMGALAKISGGPMGGQNINAGGRARFTRAPCWPEMMTRRLLAGIYPSTRMLSGRQIDMGQRPYEACWLKCAMVKIILPNAALGRLPPPPRSHTRNRASST